MMISIIFYAISIYKKDKQMKTVTYILPIYWGSCLVNNDPSNLEDEEIEEINAFITNEIKINDFEKLYCVGVEEDSYFKSYNDANNLGGDVTEFTFLV